MDCASVREDMLDVLYGEADAAAARRVDEHHARCAACREELAALEGVRRSLQSWRDPTAARAPRGTTAWLRALALAAALLLAVGLGFALRGAELRLDQGRLSFRYGVESEELHALLADQDRRHRQEIEALRASLAAPGLAQQALLERVQELIRESETRQAVAWNASLADFADRSAASRRYDLARMSAGLSYLDGKTGQQVARTNELVGYVLKASQER